ncbi:MAG: transposase [Deltaproteobacteria bacterium]|jgi:REP element-mobilizing transposase RayT|nr:transposase [Deltaproteobacteria bacterium]MCK5185799.1 transposase [Deltaproteobacteria bacterium]
MVRQARLDAPGTLHHVIIRGIEKGRIVDDQKDRENFVSRMGEVASDTKTAIYGWSLMTNHAHILLRSGPFGLSKYMRRLLTGYAISYNHRHSRYGHLFQNRYKSIVCDEDSYFRELLRYIHLNPLRAKLVKGMSELNKYPWCGHVVLMDKIKYEWQDRDYVLSWFGKKDGEAKKAYCKYIEEGISLGKRPDLVGGGLVRSLGGWSEVMSLRSHKQQVLTDERVLGAGDFVENILKEADERLNYQLTAKKRRQKMQEMIEEICEEKGINIKELHMGSRRGSIPQVRADIAYQLINELGIPLAEIARQLGVSTSAITKSLQRRTN